MKSGELKKLFFDFFKSKGHTIIPSASLIPENDSTVLFTTAGMHPLVPYLLGEVHPGGKRVASVQKCIRTGDIDEVGDDVHLTFFEMLGNWSFGDYWKKEAIEWSFEFLTKVLKLPKEKLAVSCFVGDSDAPRDEESSKVWEALGIPKNRIYFFGKKDNWWGPAGITGPCGPDTEMFYWTGEGEPEPLTTGDNKSGWVEIWNDVFMQYNKTADGRFEQLKQKNVDTGMGLERTLVVLNGKQSVYETELFVPIIDALKKRATSYYDERKVYIVADHIKAVCFLIADGVIPGKEERNYIPRRLIRDAMTVHYLFIEGSINVNFFLEPVNKVIEIYRNDYPELLNKKNNILSVLLKEAEDYSEILKLIRDVSDLRKLYNDFKPKKVWPTNNKPGEIDLSGKSLFDIRQSLGVSWAQMKMVAEKGGYIFSLETEEEYNESYKKHQELSRTASAGKFKGGLADNSEEVVKLHTVTHLLHQALTDILGGTVDQKGANITPERLRFDFACPRKLTDDEIANLEKIVNQKIKEELPVHFELLTVEEAKAKGAHGIFEDKYAQLGNKLKVYFIGDYSKEICGGPHVKNTREIGSFKIIKEEASSAGVRRIRAVIK
ncbi:MAG: alanine--tRNA ligase [Patescibacteria group bacterium]|nr:alanine--tRNA ligase [Patescibacteria group bacterium]